MNITSLLHALRVRTYRNKGITKINLCGAQVKIPGYFSIDLHPAADLQLDLEEHLLPFDDEPISTVVCMSAINYFSRERGATLIQETYRVLAKGGVARFGVQDLKEIARKYINNDREFFYQKHPTKPGRDRFPGETIADKINTWFYGYPSSKGTGGKYFYDYETLALLFTQAGFTVVEQRPYQNSRLPEVQEIDNRPDQMFFLEAVK